MATLQVIEQSYIIYLTVEPLNKGHFGTNLFVLCKEIVLFGRLKTYKNYIRELFWDLKLCPLYGGYYIVTILGPWECPLLEVILYGVTVTVVECLVLP